MNGKSWWTALKSWINPPPLRTEKIPAVCIPPGARLRIQDVPRGLQKELGVGPAEEVVFVELSASAYSYRDGIRFRNCREILLQYLDEGLRMDVLSLEGTESAVQLEPGIEDELRLHSRL
jgi:hypothetical protein